MKYFTIKDVAERTGISAYTLRYYDKEGKDLLVCHDDSSSCCLFYEKAYRCLTYLCNVARTAPLPAKSSRTMPSICSPSPAS